MTSSTLPAALTHERMMLKYTGGGCHRPSREEIARLAHRFYEARGGRDGSAVEDWLSAERELTHHYQ